MTLGIAMYSLHRAFREGGLKLTDAPRLCAERLGITLLDPTSPLMNLADDASRAAFKKAADDAGCRINTVAVGHCGDLAADDKAERLQAIEQHKPWFERCRELGAFAFRANTGGDKKEQDYNTVARCQESFAQLADWGSEYQIKVLIENHGGVSANAFAVTSMIDAINSPWVATVPDFGNLPDKLRYGFLERLMIHAVAVHAKLYEFDTEGRHTRFDLKRCLDIVKNAGFKGPLSIEFEGPIGEPGRPKDEWEGVLLCKQALAREGWV